MGRIPSESGPKNPVKYLTDKHRAILRRLAWGRRVKNVAAEFGVSRQTVSRVRNSPLGREYTAELNRETDRLYREKARAAIVGSVIDSCADIGERRSEEPAGMHGGFLGFH